MLGQPGKLLGVTNSFHVHFLQLFFMDQYYLLVVNHLFLLVPLSSVSAIIPLFVVSLLGSFSNIPIFSQWHVFKQGSSL